MRAVVSDKDGARLLVRHTGLDPRAFAGATLNPKTPACCLGALFHADQSVVPPRAFTIHIKPETVVCQPEHDLAVAVVQPHPDLACPCVPDSVGDGFLANPEHL